MPLSSDPVLGDWKVVANDGYADVEQSFKVDKYGIKIRDYSLFMVLKY